MYELAHKLNEYLRLWVFAKQEIQIKYLNKISEMCGIKVESLAGLPKEKFRPLR